MTHFTFVHAADLHLDTPFEGLGRVAPEAAAVLRDSSLAAWDALVTLCLQRGVQVLLLAGDIYDGEERGLRAQLRFLRGLERLSEGGVRVFAAHGNHDPHGGRWTAIREWPPGVIVFGHEKVESVTVTGSGGRPVATVHGISHASPAVSENLALRFRRGPEACVHLGLLHCNVDGDPDHPAYSPCSRHDLIAAGMDYWALGHIHRHRVLASDPWIVYSGGLQGRSLKPSERGTKGAVAGTLSGGAIRDVRFVPVPHVRFAELQVDIGGLVDASRLIDRLQEDALRLEDEEACAGLVVRATLVGGGALHDDLGAPERVADLLKTLREEAQTHRPFLWWSEVANRTRPGIDREAIRRRGDFSAELVELASRLGEDERALQDIVDQELRVLQAGSLRRWMAEPEVDTKRLLEEAEAVALERLEARNGG